MNIIHRIVLISALLAPGAVGIAHAKAAATFGTEIGGALLCKDQLDNKYFFDYLSSSFGAPYKQEGGAYWFRTPGASLWGVEVTDVMVNDPNSPAAFVGARVKMNPFALSQLISKNAGILFSPQDSSGYPLRESPSGSIIAYDNMTAKIYCAKSKYLVPGYVDQ